MSYAKTVNQALGADATATAPTVKETLHDALDSEPVATVSAIAMTYHGYKRTGSLIWALIYGAAGKWFPIETVPLAFAQGFGKKKECP